MEINNLTANANREKSAAALSSVAAAVVLTVIKLIVGLATQSLGILAEAAHSGLDLVAALVTFIAVRVSGKPADREHTFGHGKVENFSALIETFLLLATCVWIIYESIQRLFYESVEVDASLWAFLVMGISIVVDVNRSRMLYRAAKKHNSQALEADALHFSTDIWSSSVVIVGLVGVRLAAVFTNLRFLEKADAIAALVVAGIVIYVSIELGIRTIQGLLDQAPKDVAAKVEQAVEAVPGIVDCHRVRVRPSGPEFFIDVHVLVSGEQTLKTAHELSEKAAAQIRMVVPRADVTVHVEPVHILKKQDKG
jgi:cation diffusion facilitator family transporter